MPTITNNGKISKVSSVNDLLLLVVSLVGQLRTLLGIILTTESRILEQAAALWDSGGPLSDGESCGRRVS